MISAAEPPKKNPFKQALLKAQAPKAEASTKSKAPLDPSAPAKPINAKSKKKTKPAFNFFLGEPLDIDTVDEDVEKAKLKKILRLVQMQALVIVGMGAFFVMGSPFFETVFQYYALDSSQHIMRLVALNKPNMTNQAILSWATNSITEIMTFGFGDYIPHLRSQQKRFTPDGWKGFVTAFDKVQLGQTFKERQLVLTTVPSDTAVILSQGPTPDHVYEWKVQMPVVMTYATNDNVTHRDHAIIELTISRVDPNDNPSGIAIKNWTVGG